MCNECMHKIFNENSRREKMAKNAITLNNKVL